MCTRCKKKPTAALMLFFWLALVACSGAKTKTSSLSPAAPIDQDLLKLVPADQDAMAWIDLAALRASPLWPTVDALARGNELSFLPHDSSINPMTQVDEVVAAMTAPARGGDDQFAIVFKGSIAQQTLLESMAKDGKAVSEQFDGLAGVRGSKLILVTITEKTYAAGTERMIVQIAKLARREGRSLRDDPHFADMNLDGPIAARARYRRGAVTPDLSRYSDQRSAVDMDAITDFDAAVSLADTLSVDISAATETEHDASSMASQLDRERRRAGRNMFVVFLGIDWLLDRISIKVDEKIKNRVRVSIKFDNRDLQELTRLAERLRKLRELAEPGAEQPGMVPRRPPARQ